MISATDKPWNSATTLYIARKLEELAVATPNRKLDVLDLGCGEGTVMEQLFDYNYELYGYDLGERTDVLRTRFGPRFQNTFDDHIRIAPDERSIPFANQSFDVIYANQVFEHIKFLDRIYAECARVLRPGGVLITLFPLATYPVELHAKIPFAHWIPPGRVRIAYLQFFYALGLRPRWQGTSAHESAVHWDETLRKICYYRFMNEIQDLSEYYFENWQLDTASYIRAKVDLLNANPSAMRRKMGALLGACEGPTLDYLITHLFGAVFVLKSPRLAPPPYEPPRHAH
jgi:SAM-dependent methyltransferase